MCTQDGTASLSYRTGYSVATLFLNMDEAKRIGKSINMTKTTYYQHFWTETL